MDLEHCECEQADVAVIGAGVVGLATARALALAGREVVVLEAEKAIGMSTSSRNSEVIHAGIYYQPDSLKARLCVKGKAALYAYCCERGVTHTRLGKLLVASDETEISKLRRLKARAERNGVHDLVWLTEREARALEPDLTCAAALLSPSSGIVNSHELMLSYQGDLENSGGVVILGAKVTGGKANGSGIILHVDQNGAFALACRHVVNCAGLDSQNVARSIEGFPSASIPRRYLAKGNYFRLVGRAPFRHLIYPLPSGGGAGIHLTLDHGGQARFGPDVQWVDEINYQVSEDRLVQFETAIRKYWPALPDGALVPDYCGIRSKLHSATTNSADFLIQDGAQHGAPGLINLYGIESPGLTASLAVADYVRNLVSRSEGG